MTMMMPMMMMMSEDERREIYCLLNQKPIKIFFYEKNINIKSCVIISRISLKCDV
jgi:hypothetical protein